MRAFASCGTAASQCGYCHVMEPTRDMASGREAGKKTGAPDAADGRARQRDARDGLGKPAAEVTKRSSARHATAARRSRRPELAAPPPPRAPQSTPPRNREITSAPGRPGFGFGHDVGRPLRGVGAFRL